METKQELLTLNGKEYLLDIKQAEKLGLLKEKDNRVKSWKDFPKNTIEHILWMKGVLFLKKVMYSMQVHNLLYMKLKL